ncbi:MAG: hypothetical protein WCA22_07880 [Candidatus Binatus sp.]
MMRTLPFLALSVAYMGARVFALGFRGALGLPKIESMTIGIFTGEHRITEILTTLPMVIAEYFKLLAVPWLAGPAHSTGWVQQLSLALYGPAAALFVLAMVAVLLVRRSHEPRIYIFSAIWFAVALAPAMNLNKLVAR